MVHSVGFAIVVGLGWFYLMQSQPLRGWKLGLTTSHVTLGFSLQWMCTRQHFVKVGLGYCVDS